jgi:NAD(P)-dependent dehydrogenase (short-subunit alcohol dehydrogenase family)
MTILITGANRGIGKELALRYAKSGQRVIGTTRSEKPTDAPGVEWQVLDVSDAADIKSFAKRLQGRPVSFLVCNAGVYLDREGDRNAENWAKTFAVNVAGVALTIESLLPNLKAARGKIAIISSGMGSSTHASGGSYMYRASKAAVTNLGRNLAVDLKSDGIAVGIYHPGWVRTDMGGSGADISVEESAAGLMARFTALDIGQTGCFENYAGTQKSF